MHPRPVRRLASLVLAPALAGRDGPGPHVRTFPAMPSLPRPEVPRIALSFPGTSPGPGLSSTPSRSVARCVARPEPLRLSRRHEHRSDGRRALIKVPADADLRSRVEMEPRPQLGVRPRTWCRAQATRHRRRRRHRRAECDATELPHLLLWWRRRLRRRRHPLPAVQRLSRGERVGHPQRDPGDTRGLLSSCPIRSARRVRRRARCSRSGQRHLRAQATASRWSTRA